MVAGPIDASAIGNIIVQMIAQGECENVAAARSMIADSFPLHTYQPQDADAWNARYAAYKRLYKS